MSLFLMRPTTKSNEIIHDKKSWRHEIRTRKKFGPTKHSQRHDGTKRTRPAMARDQQNLAHGFCFVIFLYFQITFYV